MYIDTNMYLGNRIINVTIKATHGALKTSPNATIKNNNNPTPKLFSLSLSVTPKLVYIFPFEEILCYKWQWVCVRLYAFNAADYKSLVFDMETATFSTSCDYYFKNCQKNLFHKVINELCVNHSIGIGQKKQQLFWANHKLNSAQ